MAYADEHGISYYFCYAVSNNKIVAYFLSGYGYYHKDSFARSFFEISV